MAPLAPQFDWVADKRSSITIHGVSLEARCFGPAPNKAPTIVLLHEGLGCIDLWRDVPETLVRLTGHGVFAYSRQGYGKSDPAKLPRAMDYMRNEAIEVLPQVLDAFGFVNGVLMGHSDGASIAAIYAGSVQDMRVRGLVLLAPHFFTETDQLLAIEQVRQAYENTGLRKKLSRYHSNIDNAFRGWNDAWLDPEFKDWNISDAIDYWRVPVLLIQGVNDQFGSMAQVLEVQNRIYSPVDSVILEDCEHSPHIEKSEATFQAVREYLDRLTRIENEIVSISPVQ